MTIEHKWVVLDTNVWIFGLRESPERPACIKVLQRLPRLYVHVPRQILLSESRDFLAEIKGLLFQVFSAEEVLRELGEIGETSKE